ncbi:MAG: S8 family peptidase [Myxococcota bacterium]
MQYQQLSGVKGAFGALAAALILAVAHGEARAQSVQSGPAQRLIVKMRSVQGSGTATTQRRVLRGVATRVYDRVARGQGIALRRVRDLAVARTELVSLGRRLSDAELSGVMAAIASDPAIESVEVDQLLQPVFAPNDPRYADQWHYFESTGGVRAPEAWDTTDGAGAVVAVIDTGYRPHPDLVPNLLPGYDMISDAFVGNDGNGRDSDAIDPGDWTEVGECGGGEPTSFRSSSWHGTHVAGTVSAAGNNGTGVTGLAYGAKVVPIRALGKCGGFTSDIADAIVWASGGSVPGVPSNPNPADVINLSLGGGGSCPSATQSAINTARANGATVVVAAGNSNANASNFTPASCGGVISVASTNRSGGRSYFSNFGSVVDVAAPGGDIRSSASNGILSTLNSGTRGPGSDTYEFYQGTSMAAPHVAAIAGLLYSLDASLSPTEVESIIVDTARSFPSSCSGCGSGIANTAAAVAEITGGGGTPGDTVLSNGVPVTGLSGGTGSERFFTLDVEAGASNLAFTISGGSGDADLYVRFGSPPTTSTSDCRPFQTGNNETCNFANPSVGTYFVMLRGYSSYSGVTLTGSYSVSTSGPTCPAGSEVFTGTLNGTNDNAFEPGGTYYQTFVSGPHIGTLTGPSNADFDLELWRWNGSDWSTVASSTSGTSNESIQYSGSAGYYVWRVESYSGSGDYTFCMDRP